jgi:phosphotransferase system HPr-like phosphotransfer protein
MKSIKFLSTFALAATLFVQTLSANNIENTFDLSGTTVRIASSFKTIILNLGDVQKEEITIKIQDGDENTLLNETVKNVKGFTKKYNLSRLENGSYQMIITKKTVRTVQPFKIEDGQVKMTETEKKEKFLPIINFKDEKLDVNVLLGNYSNIVVKLYDNEGREIMTDKHLAEFKLNKRYNLSKLPAGIYLAEVLAGDETFSYTVIK